MRSGFKEHVLIRFSRVVLVEIFCGYFKSLMMGGGGDGGRVGFSLGIVMLGP